MWGLRREKHQFLKNASFSQFVCMAFDTHADQVPGCVFHKSSVIIKAGDMTISGAAWLGWQQSSDHLMERFISIMLHYQMRKQDISVQENRRTLKVFFLKKKEMIKFLWSDLWRLMVTVVWGFLQGCPAGVCLFLANTGSCSVLLFARQPGLSRSGKQGNDAERCN